MLGRLLTPLRARFDLTPRSDTSFHLSVNGDDELAPEDFARDVLVELMRNSIEHLKEARDRRARTNVLVEIQRIMLQDVCTKDVLRELDGFLVLTNVLSTVQSEPSHVVEPEEQVLAEVLECTRLAFMILSEGLHEHAENTEYFDTKVGYEVLAQAIRGLISDPITVNETFGLILSLALHKFAASGLFSTLQDIDVTDTDAYLLPSDPRLGPVCQPGAAILLWDLLDHTPSTHTRLRHSVALVLDRLSKLSHRNLAVLSDPALVRPLITYCMDNREGGDKDKERYIVQKLLRRLLDMGATTTEARTILQQAIKEDGTLDGEVLEMVRGAMKSRWPEHFSLESSALLKMEENAKGLPPGGFTFMVWLCVEKLPREGTAHAIFSARLGSQSALTLSLRSNGQLELASSGNTISGVFSNSNILKSRWMHIALVHYPHRASNPTIRLFIDGVLNDVFNWAYPRIGNALQPIAYTLGEDTKEARMSWCIASAYLIGMPLANGIPRFVQHLSSRYSGNFQDPTLARFLTYEASTSLNIFLSLLPSIGSAPTDTSLLRAVKDGLGISEGSIVFAVTPASLLYDAAPAGVSRPSTPLTPSRDRQTASVGFRKEKDVVVVKARRMDNALWKIGGAAVPLRLVQIATTPHEVSRALGILTDGLRHSWQNSEDMERLRGYEILANILRAKSQLINMTGFETLFEFLGLNFRSPDHSTVTNKVAYRALALDFELWSRTRPEIQNVHLAHFATLLQTSRYKKFNIKQRFVKFYVVRKLLFVLQTEWYAHEVIPEVVEALRVVSQAHFSTEETIKPIVSYLAANLQDESGNASSPRSIISRIDYSHRCEKAEKVLGSLLSILSVPASYTKFISSLPLPRICLLLLGDRPSSSTATQILQLISMSLNASSSFSRKFELVSGWSTLKVILPSAWDHEVHNAVFDILLGRSDPKKNGFAGDSLTVVCPHIVPTIFAALHRGLECVSAMAYLSENHLGHAEVSPTPTITESVVEELIEELIDLHSTSPTFRQVFKSQQTTQSFVDGYKTFVVNVSSSSGINQMTIRILEKLAHFGLTLALDPTVAGPQKQEILDTLRRADVLISPQSSDKVAIDPTLIVDGRSTRQRIISARLSMHVSERATTKSMVHIHEWRKSIITSERKRLRKTFLDMRENVRQVSRQQEWTVALLSERGLWAHPSQIRLWRLDETEGPHRIRKKLEPQDENNLDSRVDGSENIRDVHQPDPDAQSIFQVEVPPWAEGYEISTTDADDHQQLAEEISEDKHRRVRHELEPGDIVQAVGTVARVAGVDSSPGLLIFGNTHLYMLDGLVESDDGEIIDAHDAPKRLFFVPGSIVELDGPQKAQRWTLDQIATFSDRTFLFRDVALEIYFKDSRSLLIVFLDKKRRHDMSQRLSDITSSRASSESLTPGLLKTPIFGKVSAKVMSGLRLDHLATAQRKWQAREISNFTYLSILNQISGRTPSDATQYPIFPWVLKDYSSKTLDLSSPDSFRDLTKPMGALTPSRCEAAHMRYTNLESVNEKPFHYGTHFSSSMIVCHFLIRLAPFTNMFKTLQGGDWDLPDRLFSDLPRAYDSASQDVRGDVRELIPEFFTCPEFLENSANIDFGIQQNNGERIHHVKLPPWAKQDPFLFITLNRKALESDYVSENLPAWIDLIWGCKQRDPESLNVFHPLSYEGSIDLDSITDPLEREATVGIIHNFGQTPRKLFTLPHPERFMHGLSSMPIGNLHGIEEDPTLIKQDTKPIRAPNCNGPVKELIIDSIGERIVPFSDGVACVPSRPHEQVEWGQNGIGRNGGGQLRVVVDSKIVQVIEAAFCTCAVFADADHLVTGSSDHTVRLWRVTRSTGKDYTMNLSLSNIMRVHTAKVLIVTASRPWSIVVSGSKDGSAAIWDLNRGVYIRSIWHGEADEDAVHLVAVNESTGNIATCSRSKLCLHTVNARHVTTLDLQSLSTGPAITSLAFHEREYSRVGILATGGPDGTITLRTWNADGTPVGERAKWEFATIITLPIRVNSGEFKVPSITALKFIGESLCHGEDTGRAYMWTLPD